MGQLDNLELPTKSVIYKGKTLTVQGLTLPHITLIARHHGEILSTLYLNAIAGNMPQDVVQIALTMADEFAPLAGLIIACGMGEPEQAKRASELIPFALQCELLEAVIELTLLENDGLGKVMEIVTRLTAGLSQMKLSQPQTP